MSTKFTKARVMSLAALAAGFVIAGPAIADTTEIVVEAPHVERSNEHVPPGGVQVNLISMRYRVGYSDLNLATHSGATALEARVKEAATNACKEIDRLYPMTAPADEKPCIKAAVDGAAAKVHEAIAAAEAKAKK